jgi:hypothetical protein
MRLFRTLAIAFLFLLAARLSVAEDVTVWTLYEIELTAQADLARPYVDGLPEGKPGYVKATFRGEGGNAKGRELHVARRITYLVDHGLMPSVVASWGYYVHFMGADKMRRHWRYMIARYGAFPVAWILCGESRLPWYRVQNR